MQHHILLFEMCHTSSKQPDLQNFDSQTNKPARNIEMFKLIAIWSSCACPHSVTYFFLEWFSIFMSGFQYQHQSFMTAPPEQSELLMVRRPWENRRWCCNVAAAHSPLWSPLQLVSVRAGGWSILPRLSRCVCDQMSGQAPQYPLIIWTLSLFCAVGGSSAQIRLVCFMFGVTYEHTVQWKWCCCCLKTSQFPYLWVISNRLRLITKRNKKKRKIHSKISREMPLSSIIQVCEISSIFWFCDAFSTDIKSFSHSASLGSICSVPLWVAGMVCLLHMKEIGLSCFLQMFIHHGSASEKALSLWSAVCKLIDLFGLGRLHATHIWSNQISNYVVSNFMFASSCDKLNCPPEKSGWIFNVKKKGLIAWHVD